MKLVVEKYIYARVGQPLTTVEFSCYRSPGEIITVDDIVIGTEIGGNAVWYHNADDGCYYWSGGFAKTSELLDKRREDNTRSAGIEEFGIYQSAANELNYDYEHISGYKGIAAGFKILESSGETLNSMALIFYVDAKISPGDIGKTINYRGVALNTDVQKLGEVELHAENPDTSTPLPMGGSIASIDKDGKEDKIGSRSLIVKRAGKSYLLTCYHVACSTLFAAKTYELTEEVLKVNVPSNISSPGKTEVPQCKVFQGGFGPNYDYALVDIESVKQKFVNRMPGHLFNNGFYTIEELSKDFTKETRVFKFGITSKETRGFFKAYPANNILVDKKKGLKMSGLMQVNKLSKPGDSGGPVVDSANKLIGYIIGSDEESSFILPIARLESDFHFTPDF